MKSHHEQLEKYMQELIERERVRDQHRHGDVWQALWS